MSAFAVSLQLRWLLGALSLSSQSEGSDSGGLERERGNEWGAESVSHRSPLFQFMSYFSSGAKMHRVKLLTQIFERVFFSTASQGMHFVTYYLSRFRRQTNVV